MYKSPKRESTRLNSQRLGFPGRDLCAPATSPEDRRVDSTSPLESNHNIHGDEALSHQTDIDQTRCERGWRGCDNIARTND
jgi:hypothetical protein